MVWFAGMSALSPLGRSGPEIMEAALAGRSAVTCWKGYHPAPIYSKIGGDLFGFDVKEALKTEVPTLPEEMARRLKYLALRLPRQVQLSLWLALKAWQDLASRMPPPDIPPERIGVIMCGHNLNTHYIHRETKTYLEEPDFLDGLFASSSLDSIHAAAVSELLGARGPCYTVGAACASGIHALRAASRELLSGEADLVYVVGGVTESAPAELDNMVAMQAVAGEPLDGDPAAACRPFDQRRFGFVPAQGGGCLILGGERFREASYGRLVSIAVCNDAQHLPVTSQEGQERAMKQALSKAGLSMGDIAAVNAHATSTIQGDLTEINAIRALCEGAGRKPVPVYAPKSHLGHCLWSAALIETALALLQIQVGRIPGTRNLEKPAEDWISAFSTKRPQRLSGRHILKNAFGFGGYNGSMILAQENWK
ncbi:beta-ketoacyl-[acyl-carrier-protein] synthase family protein [Aestuariispira insulae]|uniref:Malonyl-ACP decarboxylase/3-oxoacyl-[acyl-carrier-protein] synthase-1 n=1 Tax=Aestuariispira insulae TaxID=1461337 RepID=A0A3D9H3E2_9PROT|nr:beta-ketoacyl-[acyl-carrier-protein] synthase family protein [Aestuariispira insulae]RED43711.1 malonyl-ACP decarboxylase/3-oxoacyl-[acyl-carrier-protein] synthase-1 [Aestuariispira insulae]